MLPDKIWAYIIEDASGRSLYIDTNGSVQPSSTPKPLKDNPKGWNDIEIKFQTSSKYFSLNKSASIPLIFVNDGADIIRFFAYKGKGYEEEKYIHIFRWNEENGMFEREYRGKLDFSKIADDPAIGVTINTIEGGLLNYLNANDNVTYELPCDETNPDAIKVLFDGVKLFDKYNFKILNINILNGFHTFPTVFLNNEGDSVGIIHGDQSIEPITGNSYLTGSSNYLFQSANPITVRIKGRITITNVGGSGNNQIGAAFQTSLLHAYDAIPFPAVVLLGQTRSFDFDVTINLAANEKLFFIFASPGFSETFLLGQESFFIEFSSVNSNSTAYALRPLNLLKQLVSKITNGKYTAESAYFTANNRIVTTSGPALRQFKDANGNIRGVLKASFQDFFNSYDPDCNLGVKIVDNVLYIELKEDLYNDDAQIFDLGEVADLKVSVASEYLVNTMKTGSPSQDYNERNGRFEFNNTFEWKLPVTAIQKELNKVVKFRQDCYGIEFIRGALNNKDTTDNKADNEVFMVVISNTQDADGNFLLSRPSYSSVSGLHPDMPLTGPGAVYNTELSPKRKLLAWGNYLRSLLFQLPAEKITFQTADKNKDLSTTLGSVTIKESADVIVSKLDKPLFLPLILEFTTQVPYTFSKVLSQIGNGNIKLSYNGNTLYCLPIGDMTAKPVNDEAQEWKLLVSPKTSLLTLLKLSSDALFLTDYNNNAMIISNLNPVHFVKYNYQLHAKYHHKDIYDDWVHKRNNRFAVQPAYTQKWQTADNIRLQVITAGLSQLSIKIYDCDAQLVDTVNMDVVANPVVQVPNILLQANISLENYEPGNYLLVIFSGATPLAVSEWQRVDVDFEDTLLIEYYHTRNKQDAYFSTWKPTIRVEADLGTPTPKSTSTEYMDEPGDVELLDANTYWVREVFFPTHGLPEWMGIKLNNITLLNRVSYDSAGRHTRIGEMETTKRSGYPFDWYKIEVRPSQNKSSLSIIDTDIEPLAPGGPLHTWDAEAFGMAPGVIQTRIVDED